MFDAPLHHCYFCFGYALDDVARELTIACGMPRAGNPDVTEISYDVFGIDDARVLVRSAYLKPLGAYKLFVIATHSITSEAQNALLKFLEEPPRAVHIAFALPESAMLLGTVLSRGSVLKNTTQANDIRTIIQQTPAERLRAVEVMLESEDDTQIERFLNSIEQYAHSNVPETKLLSAHILEVRKALAMRGTSKKQLLESVVLMFS